jgi:hypothetical protein
LLELALLASALLGGMVIGLTLLYLMPVVQLVDGRPCKGLCVLLATNPRIGRLLTRQDAELEQLLDAVMVFLRREGLPLTRPLIRRCGPWVPDDSDGAASLRLYNIIVLSHYLMTRPAGEKLFAIAHEAAHLVSHDYKGDHWLLDLMPDHEEVRADAVAWLALRSVRAHADGEVVDRVQFLRDVIPALTARARGICPIPTAP